MDGLADSFVWVGKQEVNKATVSCSYLYYIDAREFSLHYLQCIRI